MAISSTKGKNLWIHGAVSYVLQRSLKKIFYCKKIDSDKSQCKNSDYSVGGDFHPVLRRGVTDPDPLATDPLAKGAHKG